MKQTVHNALRKGRGFTLIEVLLAMAILAVIITVVYASFSTASRSVEQAEVSRDETELARTFLARLTADIENAFYDQQMGLTIFYGKKGEAGTGDDARRLDSIDMTTLTNFRTPGSAETDLWEVGYLFKEKPDESGYDLVRREKRVLSTDPPPLEGWVDFEITDRIDQLRLRYYDGAKWLDEWDTRNLHKLPFAVEITLVIDGTPYVTETEVKKAQY